MWGETPPRTADKTLQSYVTRLRKGLGSESIVRAGAAYRLDLPGEAVDVVRFRKHLDGGNVEAALAESAALSTISPAAVAELHRMDEPYLAALIELAGVASGPPPPPPPPPDRSQDGRRRSAPAVPRRSPVGRAAVARASRVAGGASQSG